MIATEEYEKLSVVLVIFIAGSPSRFAIENFDSCHLSGSTWHEYQKRFFGFIECF
jgi:hypothetical protein